MPPSLRERREAIVRDTWSRRTVHDFDATIGTFTHPHYELMPDGFGLRRRGGGAHNFKTSRTAFPDQRNE